MTEAQMDFHLSCHVKELKGPSFSIWLLMWKVQMRVQVCFLLNVE